MRKNGKEASVCKKDCLVSPAMIFFLGLIAAIAISVASAATVRRIAIESANPATEDGKAAASRQARPAILQWMRENSAMPDQVLLKIYDEALKSVNPDLILAVCLVESNFNPKAVSDKGAMGLMGIMPGVWLDELKVHGIVSRKSDLYAIPNNIAAGVYVLKNYLARTDSLEKALITYVGGDPSYPAKVLRARREIYLARQASEKIYLVQR